MIKEFFNTEVNKIKFNLRKTVFLIVISVIGLFLFGVSMVFVCMGFYHFLLDSGYDQWPAALLSSLIPVAILLFIIMIYWLSMKVTGSPYDSDEGNSNNHSWLGDIAQFNGNSGNYRHHPPHHGVNQLNEGVKNFMDSANLKPLDIGVSALVLGLVIGASPAVRRKLFGFLK